MRKLTYLFLISTILITLTGCLKKDDFENIKIYTTSYPIEYITNKLYGEHSEIKSIYPDGTDIKKYDVIVILLMDKDDNIICCDI